MRAPWRGTRSRARPARAPRMSRARAPAPRSRRPARSFDRARPQVGELLLPRLSELLEERARRTCLVLVDLRHREADVDEHPVADLDRVVAVEQRDVDRATHARDVGLGDVVLAVDPFDELPGMPRHMTLLLLPRVDRGGGDRRLSV